MVKKPGSEIQQILRQRLIAQLIAEAHPRPAGWEGSPREVISLTAIDRMMAFRSHPLFHEIRAALERMETGTYGQCTLCSSAIPTESLMNLPTVRFCSSCGQRLENRRDPAQGLPFGKKAISA